MHPTRARKTAGRGGLALASALAVLASAPVAASEEGVDETRRWVPSLAVWFDMVGARAEGSVSSGQIWGPPLPQGCNNSGGRLCQGAPTKIQPDDSSTDTDVAPLVGGSLELMTPSLFEPVFRPRLFVHGDLAAAFAFDRNLAGQGSPDGFGPPLLSNNATNVREDQIIGQGTRAKVQIQPLVVSAGGGIAFTFDVFGRRLRLKPSFEYMRQELELSGTVRRAVKRVDPALPSRISDLRDFRLLHLDASKTKIVHGIGPGLEIEADTMRAGPFLLSVFFSGRGYYLLGDLSDTLTTQNSFCSQADPTMCESATFTFDRDPWTWRGGVGLRFRLIPE